MPDTQKIQNIAQKAAEEAGKILLSYYGKLYKISKKENAGIVTEADKAAEEKIITLIKEHFPDHSILAEESGLHEHASPYKWLIDPLDGTTNFSRQIPFFCVSIGVEQNKELITAAIFDPIHKELFTAQKGKGAFCNGKKISVSKISQWEETLFITGFAYQKDMILKQELARLEPFLQKSHGIRRTGSAAWDLCQVACGHFDGFWEKYLKPWDVAAGMLIVQEAGGKVTRYDGNTATVYDHEIVASNGLIHDRMIRALS